MGCLNGKILGGAQSAGTALPLLLPCLQGSSQSQSAQRIIEEQHKKRRAEHLEVKKNTQTGYSNNINAA